MQSEEKIATILLVMASLSLAVAYLTFLPHGEYREYSDSAEIGDWVRAEGIITEARTTATGGHLILYIQDGEGRRIKVFVPEGAEMRSSLNLGERIVLRGRVSEYRGEREIVVDSEEILMRSIEASKK